MPNEIVGVELQVNSGNSEQSVKSFRTQLKEATAELIKIQEKFGDISPEAQKAAKNVAELRDRIKDANEVASLFDPEQKFAAIVGVTQGIASGFAAAQGAMALFGAESKEVEKALLKIQAATALAQGLSGIKASVEDFKRLAGVIKSTTVVQTAYNFVVNGTTTATVGTTVATNAATVAMRVFRGALLATGIGALIVLLVAAAEKFDIFGTKAAAAAEEQKKLNDNILEGNKALRDQLLAGNKDAEDLLVARAKAEGKSEAEITEIKRKAAKDRLEILKDYRASVDKDDKLASEANTAVQRETTAQDIEAYNQQAKAREDAQKKAKEQSDKAAAESKAARDKEIAERKAASEAAKQVEQETADEIFAIQHTAGETELNALAEKFRKRREAYEKDGRDTSELLIAQAIERGAIEKRYADERAAAQKEADDKRNAQIIDDAIAAQDAQTQREKEFADARIELAEREKESKIRAAQAVSGALNGFAELAGEQTAAGKVFAVASATISAILGAQQAFTSLSAIPIVGPALGAVAAAGAIAAGIANVKKILAVQVPGKGAGGGGSVPSISTNAPLSPAGAQSQSVKLDQKSINDMGNAAVVKAVVVESDITTSQERVSRMQQAASFE